MKVEHESATVDQQNGLRLLRTDPPPCFCNLSEEEKEELNYHEEDGLSRHEVIVGEHYNHTHLGRVKVDYVYWNKYIQKAVALVDNEKNTMQLVLCSQLHVPVPEEARHFMENVFDSAKGGTRRNAFLFIAKDGPCLKQFFMQTTKLQDHQIDAAVRFILRELKGERPDPQTPPYSTEE